MVEIDTDALNWCREQMTENHTNFVVVSLYKDGRDSGSFELGVAFHAGAEVFTIPLTFFTSEVTKGAYRAYSWLIDDYIKFLLRQGIPARRVLSDFES